ncbi:hypothetical protein LMG31506_02679 [Cupriavidus yeoncheonensis]|uniref:Uncharacterized protein n=1 Tax=Cupriavidus yeoncheonensis TaxID=1462994 RepID=A0A916N4E8_9BURK|nr:hypothetical protein [Cupriavidus yeoncheonensis]CAG2142452.1 hypothetical protein LMG31506_02679 [Cupriavidus yeoncheonensis]
MLLPMIRALSAAAAIAMLLAAASSAAFAAPPADSRPMVLDTQGGISDGKRGGAELRTTPQAQRGAGSQPAMAPEAAQYPLVVAPYIEVPGGGPRPPYPSPRPRPTPHTP